VSPVLDLRRATIGRRVAGGVAGALNPLFDQAVLDVVAAVRGQVAVGIVAMGRRGDLRILIEAVRCVRQIGEGIGNCTWRRNFCKG